MPRRYLFFALLLTLLLFRGNAQAQVLEPSPTPLVSGEIIYEVQAGETPQSIAAKFGLPLQTLLDLNGLSADTLLRTGQRLLLGFAGDEPETTPVPAPSADSGYPIPITLTVASDTTAPTETPIPPPTADLFRSTPTPQPDGRIIYIVQAGDTLVGIASRFGYSVAQLNELYVLNNIQPSDFLQLGQELILGEDQGAVVLLEGNIPPRYAGATYRETDNAFVHRVQAGETLIDIALRYGYRTMDEFYAVSGLSAESLITANQEVIVGFKPIPQQQGGSTDLPTATPLPTPTPSNTPTQTPTPTNTPLPFPTLAPTNTLPPPVQMDQNSADCLGDACASTRSAITPLLVPIIGIFATLLIISAAGWQWWMGRK